MPLMCVLSTHGSRLQVVLQSEGVFVPQPDDLEDVSYFVGKDDEEGLPWLIVDAQSM